MKRPLSVWCVQILLSIASLIYLPALFVWTVVVFNGLWGSTRHPMDVLLFFAEFVIKIGLLGFFVFSIVAIGKRWPKSRIMGLAALLVLFALAAYAKLNPTPLGQGLPKFELENAAQQGGAFIANILMFLGFWILFFRFGFSKKSRKFFSA